MVVFRYVGSMVAAFALVGLAGCVMSESKLASSAERLERSAYALEEEADEGIGNGFSRDAQEFAAEARDFRRTIEDQGADSDDVEESFEALSRRYHALRDEVEDADDDDAERDFEPVTQAYLDVESEMRGDDRVGERDDY